MTAGRKFDDLYDALIEEILGTPDDEILSEVAQGDIDRTRAALARAEKEVGARTLAAAKSEVLKWRAGSKKDVSSEELAARRARFDDFRSGDADFRKKATLAARNGEELTGRDLDGMADDLEELSRLEKKED